MVGSSLAHDLDSRTVCHRRGACQFFLYMEARHKAGRPRCEVLPILSRTDQDGKCESASIASKEPESEGLCLTLRGLEKGKPQSECLVSYGKFAKPRGSHSQGNKDHHRIRHAGSRRVRCPAHHERGKVGRLPSWVVLRIPRYQKELGTVP